MDQVFDSSNFISDVVWQGGLKNDSRFVSNGADYMLVYACSDQLALSGARWREKKRGLEAARRVAASIWADTLDADEATRRYKEWLRGDGRTVCDAGISRYDQIDDTGRVFNADRDLSWPGGGGPRYAVLHPQTGLPVKIPSGGWRLQESRMKEEVAAGRVAFGLDESKIPRGKSYLADLDSQVVTSVFEVVRTRAGQHLQRVLGEKRFPNPKDHEVLMRWLRLSADRDSLVLDFFGGSGTTAEAVMRLNAEDGGTRRCILVTNNEVAAVAAKKLRKDGARPGDPEWEATGVYEYVAKPRIETVATGQGPDGSTYSEGLEQNVEFFDLTYEAPLRVSTNREFAKIAPLLWMRAGSQGRRIDELEAGWDVADTYGVIEDLDRSEPFLKAVTEGGEAVVMAFVITDEDRLFQTICRELPDHVEPVRLYEAYLRNFEIESGRSSR